jgi:hypothetical protein
MMAKRRNPSPQRPKQNIMQQANMRGIFSVRRTIADESIKNLQYIADQLEPELHNMGRIFDPRTIGITEIGFSRFDNKLKLDGPATETVIREIHTIHQPLVVSLGRMAIFGTDKKAKLAFSVVSNELEDEEARITQEYANRGYKLRRDPNSDGYYHPHLSIALLYSDAVANFSDERALERLEVIVRLGEKVTNEIVLNPVELLP